MDENTVAVVIVGMVVDKGEVTCTVVVARVAKALKVSLRST